MNTIKTLYLSLLASLFLFFVSNKAYNQTSAGSDLCRTTYQISIATGNPSGINTENDGVTTGWTAIACTDGGPSTNNLSEKIYLPLSFYFYGQEVNACRISYNGILTFNTSVTTALTGNNGPLPVTNSSFPDQSIMFWDTYQVRGANDKVYYKAFGSRGSRQFWIKWCATDMGGSGRTVALGNVLDSYYAIVLEEGSNKIYFVDMKKSTYPTAASPNPLTATLGLQHSSTVYTQHSASLNLTASNADNSNSNNVCYSFTPTIASADELDILEYTYASLPTDEQFIYTLNSSCLSKSLSEGALYLQYDYGDDYRLGTSITDLLADCEVSISGYDETCSELFNQTTTLTIGNLTQGLSPEQLYRLDLSSLTNYSNIYKVGITITNKHNSLGRSDIQVRFKAWINEDYEVNVKSGDYFINPLLSINEVEIENNQATFSWTSACPNYVDLFQIQVLKLYNADQSNTDENLVRTTVNWNNALTLEVEDATSVTLTLLEGKGFYVWRVRPIGNYYDGGIANSKNWGVWTYHGAAQQDARISVNNPTSLPNHLIYFNGFDTDKNWIANRAFTEQNSIAQGIQFANGLGQLKQSQRKLNEVDSILVSGMVYDYSGRPAIQSMTAPIDQSYLGYKDELLQDNDNSGSDYIAEDDNTLYGPEDFDTEQRVMFSDDLGEVPVWENPLPMYGPIADYYSDQNADLTIPTAGNFPFARTLYHQDGRVKKQSLFGDEHRMGYYDKTYDDGGLQRTIRTYYSAVSDSELLAVFGNETPHDTNLFKIITVDPNETPMVEYKSIDGKTLATAYLNTGQHRLLDDIWPNPPSRIRKKIMGNTLKDPYTIVREQSVAFAEPGVQVNLTYTLEPEDFMGECLSYCSTCDYIVNIYIIREETDELKYDTSFTIGGEACATNSVHRFNHPPITLSDPGVYRFGRTISVNNFYSDSSENRYADYHADSIGRRMDEDVLSYFDGMKEYLEGDEADLDDLNEYLDYWAGIGGTGPTITRNLDISSYPGSLRFLSRKHDWEVTYSRVNDEYTISAPSGCCRVNLPKVACNEDLCDDYWKTYDGMIADGVSNFEGWQTNLFNEYGGYYDFEDALIDEHQSTFNSDGSVHLGNDDNSVLEEEKLVKYFYDAHGNYIYPVDGWETEATIYIEDKNYKHCAIGNRNISVSINGTNYYYNNLQETDNTETFGANDEYTESDISANTDFPNTSCGGCSTGSDMTIGTSCFTGVQLWLNLSGILRGVLEPLGYDISTDHIGSNYTININVNLAEQPSLSAEQTLFVSSDGIDGISYDDFETTEATTTDFPYGNGALNTMFMRWMNEEGDKANSCTNILSGMQQFIEDWPAFYESKGNATYAGPDFLDYLLNLCGGKQYEGFSNHPYGITTNVIDGDINFPADAVATSSSEYGPGYLEYAYKIYELDVLDETNNTIDTTGVGNCMRQFGVRPGSAVADWEGPSGTTDYDYNGDGSLDNRAAYDMNGNGEIEDDEYFDESSIPLWNTESCGAAWWDGSAIIADVRDEDMQCKAWQQLQTCISTDMSTDQQMLGIDASTPVSAGMFDDAIANRVGQILDMRFNAGKNKFDRAFNSGSSVQLNSNTHLAMASDKVITQLKSTYANTSVIDRSVLSESELRNNYTALQNIIYGDIEIPNPDSVLTNPHTYTPVASFTKTEAELFAEKMQDSLEIHGSDANPVTVNRWINNINNRFQAESNIENLKFSVFQLSAQWQETNGFATCPDEAYYRNSLAASLNISLRNYISDIVNNGCTISRSNGITVSGSKVKNGEMIIMDFEQLGGTNDTYHIPSFRYKLKNRPVINGNNLTALGRNNCNQDNIDYVLAVLNDELSDCRQKEVDSVVAHYTKNCTLPRNVNDRMIIEYGVEYTHFTLFYYDLAGNLVKTVPPMGVDTTTGKDAAGNQTTDAANISYYQATRDDSKNHTLATTYGYNALGQRISENTPDGGTKEFFYNSVGQLRFSQNAKQLANNKYSYLKYDELGRIIEAGQSSLFAANEEFASHVEEENFPIRNNTDRMLTVFSEEATGLTFNGEGLEQDFIQNRVSYAYSDADGVEASGDEIYSYYSYDAHGNVAWMLQSIPRPEGGSLTALVAYEYDLVSGKVTKVKYNEGRNDQFYHRYSYDSDNRIQTVETSRDGYIWDTDASYEYYAYGPLKRLSIGEDKNQGLDYVYTINGWLKGMNHQSLDPRNDPGNDGGRGSEFAADIFGNTLGYFNGDFKRSYNGNSSPFNSDGTGSQQMSWPSGDPTEGATVNYRPLYNGSITNYTYNTSIPNGDFLSGSAIEDKAQGFKYNYDELYRLTAASFDYFDGTDWFRNSLSETENRNFNAYKSTYAYDENGNISSLTRYRFNNQFDNLAYSYNDNTNQLNKIEDAINTTPLTTDLETQNNDNYTYNAIGELESDEAEGIDGISWTPSGKVGTVHYDNGKRLMFRYDAMGNRVMKILYENTADAIADTTFYLTNASGQTMAIYKNENDAGLTLNELPIYATSRMGEYKQQIENPQETLSDDGTYSRMVNEKSYEINDYLGNVRAVISDVKEPATDGSFTANVESASDYFPYGMIMPGRDYSSSDYRYGYQGKERDDDLKSNGNSYDFGARLLDPRVGRWLSLDPLAEEFASESPYSAMGNDPINMVDPDGRSALGVALSIAEHVYDVYQKDGLAVALGEALTYTDADDASVLMTGQHTNGEPATEVDYAVAGVGAVVPLVSGGAIRGLSKTANAVENLTEAEKTAKQLEQVASEGKATTQNLSTKTGGASGGNPVLGGDPYNPFEVDQRILNGRAEQLIRDGKAVRFIQGSGENAKSVIAIIPPGFTKVADSKRGPVYSNGKVFISPDADGHNGGIWKMADSEANLGRKETRMGTYDSDLNKIHD